MSESIVVFRKVAGVTYSKGGGNKKRAVSEWAEEVNSALRVPRPMLMDLFTPVAGGSKFSKLSPVSESMVRRIMAEAKAENLSAESREIVRKCGWTLPAEEIGRAGRVDQGVAESIRLQIKKQFGERADGFGLTVCHSGGDDVSVVAI